MPGFVEPTTLRPGDRLDRYELLCPLAYGGMAAVWLARQRASLGLSGDKLGLERLVVVKTILPQYATQEQFQRMFLDEARVASSIEHPNVARTFDVGDNGSLLYIVMEWIDGESLSKLERTVVKNGAEMPPGVVLRLIADCCAGLHAAHELRDKSGALLHVVHRDVSPQNVLVNTQGVAKLIDFGVAKARDRAAVSTTAGQLKGKVRYMSPEQALGRDSDRRADIWSMGAMLYELLVGAPPYEGPNEVATLHKLTSGAPPPPLPRHIPQEIGDIIARSLAHRPEDRFLTAAEMQEALENAMMSTGLATTTSHVAAFVDAHLGARAATRRASVEAAVAAANARERTGRPSAPTTPAPLEQPNATSTATLGSAAVEWPTDANARKVTNIAVLLGALGATALLLAGGLVARNERPQHAVPAAPTATAAVEPPADPPEVNQDPVISSTPIAPTGGQTTTPGTLTLPLDALPVAPNAPSAVPRPRSYPPRYVPRQPPPPPPTSKKRDYGF